MPFVLRDATTTENPTLAVPYGRQITTGLLTYYQKQGTQTAFISILGQGELDGVDRVYYAGVLLPEFDASGTRIWQFHPGTFSTGFSDPIQGRPTFFPDLDFTFSGIAYIEVLLPPERSSDNEPDKMKFFVRGRKVQDYTLSGDNLVASGSPAFSANNALIAADIITSFMGLPLSRINGPSLLAFRDRCDELISWAGGNITTIVSEFINVTWESEETVNGGVHRTTSGSSWGVSGAVTRGFVDASIDSYFEVVVGEGTGSAGYTSGSSCTSDSDIVFGVQWNLANHFSIVDTGVTHEQTDWAVGNVFRIAIESGVFKLYHNGILVDYAAPAVPGGSLRGGVAIFSNGAGIDSSKYFPSSTSIVSGEENKVPRFESHVVFAQGTDAASALETVMFRAPGCHWQDVDGQIKFITVPTNTDITGGTSLPVGGRALSFGLSYDPTQTTVGTNIGEGGFQANRKSVIDKPNFLRASFRDLGQQYYDIAYSFVDRKEVRAQAGSLIDPGITALGVMTQSLADRIMESQMSLLTDLDLYVSIKGMAGSEVIAKGDIVRLTHDVPEWRESLPPLFMVMEETFEPTVGSSGTADDRTFKLQVYNPDYYMDTHHGAVTGINITPTVSPFSAPPVISNVELTQRGILQPDDSIALSIDALATFGDYPYDQYGRVWVRRIEEERAFTSNGSSDLITLTNHNYDSGQPVMLSGSLSGGLNDTTLYFVVPNSVDDFKLSLIQGGSAIDISASGSGNIAPFRRIQDLLHPATNTAGDRVATFTVNNVQIGILKVIVVTENFFQIKKPFHVHPVWSVDVEAPSIPAPSNFNGYYDDVTGDLLLDWDGQQLQNEKYELEIRDTGNTTNLRAPMIIYPNKDEFQEEDIIWDSNAYVPHIPPYDDFTLLANGGLVLNHATFIATKADTKLSVNGLLFHFQIPIDADPIHACGIAPSGTFPAMQFYWQTYFESGFWVARPEANMSLPATRILGGNFLDVYVRQDNVVEYYLNYYTATRPIYTSGIPYDSAVAYYAAAYGTGQLDSAAWVRRVPEWKYLSQAQRYDNGLSDVAPLPDPIVARVRQLAYSGASPWSTGTFTR